MINRADSMMTSAWQATRLDPLKAEVRENDPQALAAAAKSFESLFLKQVLQAMRKADASLKSGLFSSSGMDMYRDFLDDEWAKVLSEKGIGLADFLQRQWSNPGLGGKQDKDSA